MLKVSSANLMSVGIFQRLVSSLAAGFVPVISDKTAQFRLSCQSICRDLMCTDTQWLATALEWLVPCMEERVWILDNLRRCTHLSVKNGIELQCLTIFWMGHIVRTCSGVQLLQLQIMFEFVVCLECTICANFCRGNALFIYSQFTVSWWSFSICGFIMFFWPSTVLSGLYINM